MIIVEDVNQNKSYQIYNDNDVLSKRYGIKIPTRTSQLVNDSGYLTMETTPVKDVNGKTGNVTLTKVDVELGNVDNVKQYSATNPPPYPVTSVNTKTGNVVLDAYDVGAIKLSDITFVIQLTEHITSTGITYTSDKTYEQIIKAYNDKQVLVVNVNGNSRLPLLSVEKSGEDIGFTFGHTEVKTDGNLVSTRAVVFTHTSTGDTWTDQDGEFEKDCVVYVTISETASGEFESSITPNLIRDAISNGKIAICKLDNTYYSLMYNLASELCFISTTLTATSCQVSTICYKDIDAKWTVTSNIKMLTSLGADFDVDMKNKAIKNVSSISNVTKIHLDGNAPVYLGSTIEPSGTSGSRITGITDGGVAFVKCDSQNAYVPVTGGTPTNVNHLTTKKYVDDKITASESKPILNGVLSVSDNNVLQCSVAATFNGVVSSSSVPTQGPDLCNKTYVDTKIPTMTYDASTKTLNITTTT